MFIKLTIKVFCLSKYWKPNYSKVWKCSKHPMPKAGYKPQSNITWNTHFDIKLTFVCFLALTNSSFCVKGRQKWTLCNFHTIPDIPYSQHLSPNRKSKARKKKSKFFSQYLLVVFPCWPEFVKVTICHM